MRICDWSSCLCSSDLRRTDHIVGAGCVDQVTVIRLVPNATAHIVYIQPGIEQTVLRLQPPTEHLGGGTELLHAALLHRLTLGPGEVADEVRKEVVWVRRVA